MLSGTALTDAFSKLIDRGPVGYDGTLPESRRSDSFDAGRMAERRVGAGAQKLRRLIAEAERAARFLDDMGDLGRYRARELRNEIAAARAET